LRIRRDCCDVFNDAAGCLVVLFEDHDLCCCFATWRSVSEICEIGEQGVSIVGSELLVRPLQGGTQV
jgi:hypothetical protein